MLVEAMIRFFLLLLFILDCRSMSIEWEGTVNHYTELRRFKRKIIATRGTASKGHVYLAIQRSEGVPFTLGKLDDVRTSKCKPFPSWRNNYVNHCSHLYNVVDVFVDKYDMLWVLDIGKVSYFWTGCSPKIVKFDLKKRSELPSKIIYLNHIIPYDQLKFSRLVVETRGNNQFVYVLDTYKKRVLIWDAHSKKLFSVFLKRDYIDDRINNFNMEILYDSNGKNYLIFSNKQVFGIVTKDLLSKGYNAKYFALDSRDESKKKILLGTNGCELFFKKKGGSKIYKWKCEKTFERNNFEMIYKSPNDFEPTDVFFDRVNKSMGILESKYENSYIVSQDFKSFKLS